ncbi:MAG TPA: hypothetical protein PKU78_00785 [Candidatus Dojkabacteria bacterium]|nr:hypothetical protein [Candidatus Dojkabacteria bacterium]HRO64736.1 hypothetical protein [Candidatus Dojkabacteria bacterium]HRP51150.1 hypothetical protein [Candidatus Dojkabacteria bacterium]
MNIEDNNQPTPPSVDETYIQSNNNPKSFAVIILAILLLITLFIFGAYIYFKEIYEPESINLTTNEPASINPTKTQPTIIEEMLTTPTSVPTEKISVDLPGVDNSVRLKKYELTKPVSAEWSVKLDPLSYTESNSGFVEGEDFTLIIKEEYEDEGYGGTGYVGEYNWFENLYYGKIYRVQTSNLTSERGSNTYTYVNGSNFKTSGTCEGLYFASTGESVSAPCGDSFLNIESVATLSIYCTADTETGLQECDKIVASLRSV